MTEKYENPVTTMGDALLQIEKQKRSYKNDLSTIDRAISDLYHDLEADDSIDLYKGWLYTKRMKRLYEARRELKNQNEQIKMLERNLNVKSAINGMDRTRLKLNREMPRKKEQRIRAYDLLNCDNIELQNGWKV